MSDIELTAEFWETVHEKIEARIDAGCDARIELAIDKLRKEMGAKAEHTQTTSFPQTYTYNTPSHVPLMGTWVNEAHLKQEVRRAVLAEREECAKLCPAHCGCGDAIRSRP